MTAIKHFTALELKAYNSVNRIPHRKVAAAQLAEDKLLPVTRRNPDEFSYRTRINMGETAEQVLERKMLHGENS